MNKSIVEKTKILIEKMMDKLGGSEIKKLQKLVNESKQELKTIDLQIQIADMVCRGVKQLNQIYWLEEHIADLYKKILDGTISANDIKDMSEIRKTEWPR